MTVAEQGYTPTGQGKKRPSLCHSCKAVVVWCLLDGKRQCLDFLEAGGGDVALEPELFARPDGSRELVSARKISGLTTHYRRHIESCPDAAKWRDRWKGTADRPFSKFNRKKTR